MSVSPQLVTPLERLAASDGLLLTAERWNTAHNYHRQRQNLHYQSLNQPGIVTGLGVQPSTAPPQVPAQYRDRRWLAIQPGLAIDAEGNPIVVPQPVLYRLTAESTSHPLVVYLVVKYVDPDNLETDRPLDTVKETFRIEEQTEPPNPTEVELCRVQLAPKGVVQLQAPAEVFAPCDSELDFRFRMQARAKPQGSLTVGHVTSSSQPSDIDTEVFAEWSHLLHSLSALYPTFAGEQERTPILLDDPKSDLLASLDLLVISYSQLIVLNELEIDCLSTFLKAGGVVVVATSERETNIDELTQVRAEVNRAIASTGKSADLADLRRKLMSELVELSACIASEIETLTAPLRHHVHRLGLRPVSDSVNGSHPLQLDADHPLRTTPFHFGHFPVLNGTPTEVLSWGGMVFVVGPLSHGWGGSRSLALSREEIRSSQEMGINLLHFAWRRRQMIWGPLPSSGVSDRDKDRLRYPPHLLNDTAKDVPVPQQSTSAAASASSASRTAQSEPSARD